MPTVGCIVLTQGRRPDDLRRATESLLRQRGVEVDVVVVGNAWRPEGLPAGARGVALAQNAGIPGGRNAGVPHARGDLLFFLDDDASLADDDALERVARKFADDPQLGLLQLRVAALSGGPPLRNWVPRLRVGDRARSSDVTAVWEGAVAIRRRVFEQVGGWPAEFRFVHEGVDLAWRVMDAGLRVRYAGDVVALHPSHAPGRHSYSPYFSMRNRVWLARRHLPLPLAALYVLTFAVRSLPALRSARAGRELLRGLRDGAREPCGERRTLRPRTLWRMTRAGRPPVL
ncbi:MAG TPA: glycosyltransferase [Solirubrobacteraceae bacterium]|nr:glycosyltransferase [Solirubrobacteraceae bacterium]